MAPTMEMPGHPPLPRSAARSMTRPVQIIGIIPEERAKTGDFAEFLVDAARQDRPIPPSFEVPETFKEQTTAGQMLKDFTLDPNDEFDKKMAGPAQGGDGPAGPRHRRDHRLCAGDLPPRRGTRTSFIAPPGTQVGLLFPRFGETKSEAGFETATTIGYFKSGMSEYDSTHVYVPLEALQKARFLYDFERGVGAVNQIQIKVRPGVDIDELAGRTPARARQDEADVLPGPDLGAETGPAAGRGGRRAEHPEHPAVLHHRRGRVRHPGDLLDDRGGEDARHRHPQGTGGLDRRDPGHLPGLRPAAGRRRQRRRHGRRAAVRPLHQRDRDSSSAR